MSVIQYQKVLNIAEALLKKVDIPSETMRKYEELKLRLLGDTFLNDTPLAATFGNQSHNEELELVRNQNTIDQEIVAIYSNFLGTLSNIFETTMALTTQHQNMGTAEDYLVPFYQAFDEKKVQIRDLILESALQPANRLILSQKLKQLDMIGSNFDTVIKKLSNFQDNLGIRNQIENQLETKIGQQEKELSNALYSLDTARTALNELDTLKARNNELEIKLEEHGLESQKAQLKLNSDLEETKLTLEESSKLIEQFKIRVDALETDQTQFCQIFEKYCSQYQNENAPIDVNSFSDVTAFLVQFVDKLESDNKWFEKAVAENVEVLKETQESLIQASQKKEGNEELFQSIEDIAAGTCDTLGEISQMQEEFRELVENGLGMKKLFISDQQA